ncbi:hypothetical protein V8C37DRAFT_43735 [Trichoderma ceciliae]
MTLHFLPMDQTNLFLFLFFLYFLYIILSFSWMRCRQLAALRSGCNAALHLILLTCICYFFVVQRKAKRKRKKEKSTL